MKEKINVPVRVMFYFGATGREVAPVSLWWNGRKYGVEKVGLHHVYRSGRTLMHVFSVLGAGVFFRLELNTESLRWRLTEVADGLPG